jgi:MtN3 and saliva related transmembrane protein
VFITLGGISNFMTFSFELIGYAAATLTTVSFLPQAIMTIKTRDTESLSMGMYSLFAAGVLLWLIYGIYLDNQAIIIANAITFVLAAIILGFKIFNTLRNRYKKHEK